MKIMEIENKLIDTIRAYRDQMLDNFMFGDLEKEYQDIVDKIYHSYEDMKDTFKGSDCHRLYERLRKQPKVVRERTEQTLELIRKGTETIIEQYQNLME